MGFKRHPGNIRLQAAGFTQARNRGPPGSGFRVPGFRVAHPEGEGVGGVAEQAGRVDCQDLIEGSGCGVWVEG